MRPVLQQLTLLTKVGVLLILGCSCFLIFICLFFCISQAVLKFMIVLSWPPKCRGCCLCRHTHFDYCFSAVTNPAPLTDTLTVCSSLFHPLCSVCRQVTSVRGPCSAAPQLLLLFLDPPASVLLSCVCLPRKMSHCMFLLYSFHGFISLWILR